MKKYCTKCTTLKPLEEFYSLKWWKFWRASRCKECTKQWRRTEKEKKMSRIIDRKRYNKNDSRKKYCDEYVVAWQNNNPKKYKAQRKINSFFKSRKEEKPTICCVCWSNKRLHMHHEDYDYPYRIYPLCPLCHSNRHAWNLKLNKEDEIEFIFIDKRKLKKLTNTINI